MELRGDWRQHTSRYSVKRKLAIWPVRPDGVLRVHIENRLEGTHHELDCRNHVMANVKPGVLQHQPGTVRPMFCYHHPSHSLCHGDLTLPVTGRPLKRGTWNAVSQTDLAQSLPCNFESVATTTLHSEGWCLFCPRPMRAGQPRVCTASLKRPPSTSHHLFHFPPDTSSTTCLVVSPRLDSVVFAWPTYPSCGIILYRHIYSSRRAEAFLQASRRVASICDIVAGATFPPSFRVSPIVWPRANVFRPGLASTNNMESESVCWTRSHSRSLALADSRRCILCASQRGLRPHLQPRWPACPALYLRYRLRRRGVTRRAGIRRPHLRYVECAIGPSLRAALLTSCFRRRFSAPTRPHSSPLPSTPSPRRDLFGRTVTRRICSMGVALVRHHQTDALRLSVFRELLASRTAISLRLSRSRNMILLGYLKSRGPSPRSKTHLAPLDSAFPPRKTQDSTSSEATASRL